MPEEVRRLAVLRKPGNVGKRGRTLFSSPIALLCIYFIAIIVVQRDEALVLVPEQKLLSICEEELEQAGDIDGSFSQLKHVKLPLKAFQCSVA